MKVRFLSILPLAVALAAIVDQVILAQTAATGTSPTFITLDVDASDAPMKILHATMSMPARNGAMTFFYPKWIPGEHAPSGPIGNLTGLHFFADGREIEWRRDVIEMNAFHLMIPAGAKMLSAKYDYIVPTSAGASANAKCAVINWHTVSIYPMGENPAAITVTASLKAPSGWKHGGALDVANIDGSTIHYVATSLASLIDNPVLLGEHFRCIVLWPAGSEPGEHVIDVIADSEWALQFPESLIEAYKRLVIEARTVSGGVGHYRKYHWLLTLSDNLGTFGIEHHECSDNRVTENTFVDEDSVWRTSLILPHEFFHSWNGKARRPAGLVNGGYEQPMKDDLLWVYEGLTNYYGELLSARAGLISAQEWFDKIAADAMSVSGPGRTWRPLQDTADAAPFLYGAGGGWAGWRRGTDFYNEGTLIWLEADVQIRRLTTGQKSLDEFCRLFLGQNDNGKVYVKPYDMDELYRTLNAVAVYDWKGFFEKRLQSKSADLPLLGIENGGFRLVYTDAANIFADSWDLDGSLNAYGSLGVHVTSEGVVDDAWPEFPAYAAGISSGMKIIAVNGRRFSVDELKRMLAGSKDKEASLELIVDNASYFKVVKVDYHGGLRYPHLERKPGTNDVLTTIATPRKQ